MSDYYDDEECFECGEYEYDCLCYEETLSMEEFAAAVAPTKIQFTLVSQEDGSENITVVRPDGPALSAHSSHPNYAKIREGVLANDESVFPLFDLSLTVGMKFERLTERITVANGMIYLDGERVDNALTKQVVRFIMDGVDDWKPLVNFFEKVMNNPNENSREELYTFIRENDLTITDNGMIVGYKGLQKNGLFYYSGQSGTAIVDGVVHTGKIPQRVGSVVEMPRSEVVYEPNYACHIGLHVGNFDHAQSYGDSRFAVHVDPRDVVSVPNSGQKMRVCRYVIVSDMQSEIKEAVVEDTKPTTRSQKVTEVRVGDVYEDRDKRRAGRLVKVKSVIGYTAHVEDVTTGKKSEIHPLNLMSYKYKLVKKGKKK